MPEILSIVHIRYQNPDNGYTVLIVKKKDSTNGVFTAVCNASFSLQKGTDIEISEGKWVDSAKYGRQYKIVAFTVREPETAEGIELYLASGVIPGIGPAMAKRITASFGDKTLSILDEDPNKLLTINGIGEITIGKVAEAWREMRATAKALSALCGLGLSLTYANKIYRHLGKTAFDTVQHNPYFLTDIYGIGFLKADEIARKLNVPPESPKRIEAGIIYTLKTAEGSGHSFLPAGELKQGAGKILSINKTIITAILNDMAASARVIIDRGVDVYLPHLHKAEEYCRQKLAALAWGKPQRTEGASVVLSEHGYLTDEQKQAVLNAVENPLTVITGLPGTGKTTVIRALISVFKSLRITYALTSPTGRAAKRLEELTGEGAKTIHRLLDYNPQSGFQRNEDNPLSIDYLIMDESSMVDVLLLKDLLAAIPRTGRMIFVGDINQLPAVGPGNVLKDLINSRICQVRSLTNIHRQASGSGIIKAAHTINSGSRPSFAYDIRADAAFICEEDPARILAILASTVKQTGFSPEDVQVLTPMRKGTLGSMELNRILQPALNVQASPVSPSVRGYYPGDRVIHLVNNYDKMIFNGEVGYVQGVNTKAGTIAVSYDRRIVLYDEDEIDQMSLAYAMTVHKAQGSQFPCVFLVLHGSHYIMLRRQLLYTAVTRAEKKLIVIGSPTSIAMAVRNDQEALRRSSLFSRTTFSVV